MKLEMWLEHRSPAVPEAFLPYLLSEGDGEGGDVTVGALLDRGLDALDRALQNPGRVRASAFPLLSADAFLTYACEEAASAETFSTECRTMLKSVGDRFSR